VLENSCFSRFLSHFDFTLTGDPPTSILDVLSSIANVRSPGCR
jgi:hypothetical protein